MKKFKINDSYTTFVIDETDIENQKERELFQDSGKRSLLAWRKGAKVMHWSHGRGTIIEINEDQITVDFGYHLEKSSKKKQFNKIVTFDAKEAKNNSLKLCT